MSSFRLQIVTPEGSLFDGQAEALRLKTSEGKHDDLPESAFLFVGTIDEAVEKARKDAAQ